MASLFPGALAHLNLCDSHLVALGTLHLEAIVQVEDALQQDGNAIASTSTSSRPAWQTYTPGLWRDSAAAELANRRRKLSSSTSSKLSKSTPTSPRSASKRKRSDSIASISSNATNVPSAALLEVPLPTVQEIDHLVRNAFIAVEYVILPQIKEEPNQYTSKDTSERTTSCILRVYAIPLDTPGLNSRIEALKLKIRSKNTKALAQKTFSKLLYHLHHDEEEWNTGIPAVASPTYLLKRDPVSVSFEVTRQEYITPLD